MNTIEESVLFPCIVSLCCMLHSVLGRKKPSPCLKHVHTAGMRILLHRLHNMLKKDCLNISK